MSYADPDRGRALDRERHRRRAADRIAHGLCPRCGVRPMAPERRLCAECGEKNRRAERARYAAGKAAGKLYGGRCVKTRRRDARVRGKDRHRAPARGGDLHGVRPPARRRGRRRVRRLRRGETRPRAGDLRRAPRRRLLRALQRHCAAGRVALPPLRGQGGRADAAREKERRGPQAVRAPPRQEPM